MLGKQPVLLETLSVITWNVNGWTDLNSCLRQKVIKILDVDIVCLTETHLRNNSKTTEKQ